MDIETKGLGAGSYPEPPEIKDKHIKAHICTSFDLEYDVPEDWTKERIIEDIKENLDDFTWYNEEIEDIEVE